VYVRVANVGHLQPSLFDPLPEAGEGVISPTGSRDAYIFYSDLLRELQVVIGETGRDLEGDLDAGSQRRQFPGCSEEREAGQCCGAKGGAENLAAIPAGKYF